MRDRVDQPPQSHPATLWPLLLTLVVVLVGAVFVFFGHWRLGSVIIGSAALFAAGLRLVLPRDVAGLLVVRRRVADVVVLVVMGVTIVVMAMTVPPGP